MNIYNNFENIFTFFEILKRYNQDLRNDNLILLKKPKSKEFEKCWTDAAYELAFGFGINSFCKVKKKPFPFKRITDIYRTLSHYDIIPNDHDMRIDFVVNYLHTSFINAVEKSLFNDEQFAKSLIDIFNSGMYSAYIKNLIEYYYPKPTVIEEDVNIVLTPNEDLLNNIIVVDLSPKIADGAIKLNINSNDYIDVPVAGFNIILDITFIHSSSDPLCVCLIKLIDIESDSQQKGYKVGRMCLQGNRDIKSSFSIEWLSLPVGRYKICYFFQKIQAHECVFESVFRLKHS